MVSTSGSRLLPEDAVRVLRAELLPLTTVLTPNVPEAQLILKDAGRAEIEIKDAEGLKLLATALHELGPKYVLLKGGHMPLTSERKIAQSESTREFVVNVLYDGSSTEVIELPYQRSRNTHGTGCSLACTSDRIWNDEEVLQD